jgi:hypothetical protein
MSAQILVISSSVSEDIYKRFWRPTASSKELPLAPSFSPLYSSRSCPNRPLGQACSLERAAPLSGLF